MTDITLQSDYGLPGGQVEKLGEITLDIHHRARQSGENYVAIGQRLIEAKNLLKHGEFKRWLDESLGMNQSTANKMMQVAETFKIGIIPNLKPTVLIELSKGNVPPEARTEAVKRASTGENVTVSTAKRIVAEHTKSEPEKWDAREPNVVTNSEPDWSATDDDEPVFSDDDWTDAETQEARLKAAKAPYLRSLKALKDFHESIVEIIESDEPGNVWLDERDRGSWKFDVDKLAGQIRLVMPEVVCPRCDAGGCETCRESGFVSRRLVNRLKDAGKL